MSLHSMPPAFNLTVLAITTAHSTKSDVVDIEKVLLLFCHQKLLEDTAWHDTIRRSQGDNGGEDVKM